MFFSVDLIFYASGGDLDKKKISLNRDYASEFQKNGIQSSFSEPESARVTAAINQFLTTRKRFSMVPASLVRTVYHSHLGSENQNTVS